MILTIPNVDNELVPPDAPFSSNSDCPNEPSSFYNTLGANERYKACSASSASRDRWNPAGPNLAMESFDFPIFNTQYNETVDRIIDGCYRKFNEPNKETGEARVSLLDLFCAKGLLL